MPIAILHIHDKRTEAMQCLFYDYAEPAAHAGILLPAGDVISLKDGRTFSAAEQGISWRLIEGLGWTDVDDYICDQL